MKLSRFLRRRWWDEERRLELEDYLDREIEDNIARGMSPDAAVRAAHRKLGNRTRIREEIYEMNTFTALESVWQDLRHGVRLLGRNPTFAVVAILTLALGTGANAAIFQLVSALRLRALPVERPHELVSIGIDTNDTGRTGRFMGRRPFFSEPLWQAIGAQQQAFSAVMAWGVTTLNTGTGGEYRPVQGLYVSGSFFAGLGVRPQLGRLFTDADDRQGCGARGAVISHGFWQSRYGGDPAVVGQPLLLEGHAVDIVGVTPAQFFGPEVGRTFDVAVPLCAEPLFRGENSGVGRPDTWFLDIMGRLHPEWTVERARAHLEAMSPAIFAATVAPRYTAETARNYAAFKLTLAGGATGVSGLRRTYAMQLWVLLGATGLVLLVACANLANLMLARATAREREIAVRLAIGASRQRIVRQLLSESLVVAAAGAIVGALLAQWISQALVALLSTETTQLFLDLSPDWRLFAFIATVAALACLLFGLSPALKATGTNPGRSIQAGGRTSTDSPERFTTRRVLVVVQVALSMILIVGALLFAKSLRNLVQLDPGFRQDGILAVGVDLRRSALDEGARGATYAEIVDRVRAVPGVLHAAEAAIVPMSGSGWNQNVVIGGEKKDGIVNLNRVGAGFFQAMETPLLAGRIFGPDDRPGGLQTAVVNESFARKYFHGVNPLGRTFQLDVSKGEPQPHYHIIGLVKDTKYNDLREEFTPIAYLAATQPTEFPPFLDLVVRSDVPSSSLTPALTRAILETVPNATVSYDTIRTYVRDSLVTERLMALLSGAFGVMALLIATIGLYGVLAYMVTRRRVEIGVRMALGAAPGRVVRMVLAESGVLLAIGLAAGVGLSFLAARWAASLLYGLEATDPASYVVAIAVLGTVSVLAAWIPARRASRVTPTAALRE